MRKHPFLILIPTLILGACSPGVPSGVRRAMDARVQAGFAPGIALAVVDSGGVRYHCVGSAASADGSAVGPDTQFQVGSITKAFTGLLASDLEVRGELKLTETAEALFKDGRRTPRLQGRTYSVADILGHRSGLARDVSYYEGISEAQLDGLIRNLPLAAAPGTAFRYSNLGYAILGLGLAARGGRPYDALLRERVLKPLGLADTGFGDGPGPAGGVAVGWEGAAPAHPMVLDAFRSAGALRSTPRDLGRLLQAELGLVNTPLDNALHRSQQRLFESDPPFAAGWFVSPTAQGAVYFHGGRVPGFRSFVAFDPARRVGVAVLANGDTSVEDLGWRTLGLRGKLEDWTHTQDVPEADLDKAAGRYRFSDGTVYELARTGQELIWGPLGAASGTGYATLVAQTPREFINGRVQLRIRMTEDGLEVRGEGMRDWQKAVRVQ